MLDSKPVWIKKRVNFNNINVSEIKKLISETNLHTVCQSAQCPNIYECFSKKTATFMLMGDICTRNCAFCGIKSGKPKPLDKEEPGKVAQAVNKMGLKYVVLTSVTRDDLSDGGAKHFAKTVKEIKRITPDAKIECLIPDLKGSIENLNIILNSGINVLNHNVETIYRLYPEIRPQANYKNSLKILKYAKDNNPGLYTKSGFMMGLGEEVEEIKKLLSDLKNNNCDILTIGQYLRPSKENYEVKKYYTQEEFRNLKILAINMGFKYVFSGIFVRSSYHASDVFMEGPGS